MPNDNATNQRKRLLDYFHEIAPRITVRCARDKLGILHAPARVHELRNRGHIINTYWIEEIDKLGITHKVGLYCYNGKKKEAKNDKHY
ncbi:MAG: hypothetical protein GY821_01785 [Gammaproteobacteria bacterium]|nr:hypothetical protein [Gammaproteobacteria bacterium]